MDTPPATPRTFGETLLAVLWSFIGLRRRSEFERDVHALRPAHLLAAAVLALGLLLALLLTAVHFAVPGK